MNPIIPACLVGGAILAETTPIAVGSAKVYRGVDLGPGLDGVASGHSPGASPSGPYRERPPGTPSGAAVPVIVREVSGFMAEEPDALFLFEQATLARRQMTGSPTPRLLHTFGRKKRVLAFVEEYVCGTPLADDALYAGTDAMPMYAASPELLIDARAVTRAEMERFFLVTRAPRPEHLTAVCAATDDDACTFVPVEVAEAYARWAGKRLPTEAEWEAAVAALGADRLGVGEVWEWTSTPRAEGGRVVRGGRWRDQPGMPPSPENRSFATSPAPDLGFRCAMDETFRRRPAAI